MKSPLVMIETNSADNTSVNVITIWILVDKTRSSKQALQSDGAPESIHLAA